MTSSSWWATTATELGLMIPAFSSAMSVTCSPR